MRNPFETEERAAFRETARRFFEKDVLPYADAWDEAGDFPWALHEKAGALGMFGLGIEQRFGGLGFDDPFLRAILGEEMGRTSLGGAMASMGSRSIMTGPLQAYASEEIKARVLPEIVSGKKGGALAVTEPSGGSDVANLQTRARRDGDAFVIDGQKTFITGGLKASYFLVGARTGEPGLGGISMFFVEADAPGLSRQSVGRKMGWWCSDTATLYFENCRMPVDQLVGEENKGFLSIMHNFNHERLTMAAQCVGMAKRCLEESVAYAQDRVTFGKPLIRHQAIRHKIADMSMKIDAMQAYVQQICWLMEQGENPIAELCKAKVFCSKALEFCASEAMQIFGGAGYLAGNPVERIYREVKVMAIGGGSEEIMRDLAVRQMGL